MDEIILIKKYTKDQLPMVDEKEVLRYAGQGVNSDENIQKVLKEAMKDAEFNFRVAFIRTEEVPFAHESKDLNNMLKDCHHVYLIAATLGVALDRKIAKASKVSQTKALLLDALGTERIEALLGQFCQDMRSNELSRGNTITGRFSPGYGDLPLEVQKDVVKILDCSKLIGVSLNDSLLMSPSKSITAIMGVKKSANKKDISEWCNHKCSTCNKTDCAFRGK